MWSKPMPRSIVRHHGRGLEHVWGVNEASNSTSESLVCAAMGALRWVAVELPNASSAWCGSVWLTRPLDWSFCGATDRVRLGGPS
jgi:hypothetical protein